MIIVIILLLHFLFLLFGGHRDLHSFPTRRSSDLTTQQIVNRRLEPLTGRLRHRVSKAIHRCPPVRLACASRSAATSSSDRKSTRLNSSHSQISYAVFCLKKKIKSFYYTSIMLSTT